MDLNGFFVYSLQFVEFHVQNCCVDCIRGEMNIPEKNSYDQAN